MFTRPAVFLVLACSLAARAADFPLEALRLSGTTMRAETVLALAGLSIGVPVNKAALDAACEKLQQTGLFATVDYRYAPGPNKGYVLTLSLADQPKLLPAVIDVEAEAAEQTWRWLMASYPRLDHRVPDNDPAQRFIAAEMERHLGPVLEGQHLVASLESDFQSGRSIIAFQPEHLPAIRTVTFNGLQTVGQPELLAVLTKALGSDGYTARNFRFCLETSLRPVFEHHGLYKTRLGEVRVQKTAPLEVDLAAAVEEGPAYTLGAVRLLGENLPVEAMLKAAAFKPGQLADWTQIQLGIYQSESPLKRTGYLSARSSFQRTLHDDSHVLDVDVSYSRGPLFHFGNVTFTGLSPELQTRARQMWKPATGAPYDYAYPSDFLREFAPNLDARVYKSYTQKAKPGAGDHVMDVELIFIHR